MFVAAGASAVDRWGPNASAEQIADAAGVSRTVLYRYFRDREDLRKAIADHVISAVLESVLPELQVGPQSTPRTIITATVSAIMVWLDEHPNLYRFLRTRRDGALDSVETTLADNVAGLLKLMMMLFGIDAAIAEPGAYGIVGCGESTGGWWLEHRAMSRDAITELITAGVWHLLDGTARRHGIDVGYDDPLPLGALRPVPRHPTIPGTRRADAVPEDDGYDGPAELLDGDGDGDGVVPVTVTLRGHFDPISGTYSWYGRVAATPEVAALVHNGNRRVRLRTPWAEVDTALSDVDPWGRPRVEGVGQTPFDVLDTVPADTD